MKNTTNEGKCPTKTIDNTKNDIPTTASAVGVALNTNNLIDRICDHQHCIDQEMAWLSVASDRIVEITITASKHNARLLRLKGITKAELFHEIRHGLLMQLEQIETEAFNTGYNWASNTPDIGFLTTLLDHWTKPEDENAVHNLLVNRWPNIPMDWEAFIDGACCAHNEATDVLLEEDESD